MEKKLSELERLYVRKANAEKLFSTVLHTPSPKEWKAYLIIKKHIYFLETIKFLLDTAPETLDVHQKEEHLKVVVQTLNEFSNNQESQLEEIRKNMISYFKGTFSITPGYMDYSKNLPNDHVSSYKNSLKDFLFEFIKVWKKEHHLN